MGIFRFARKTGAGRPDCLDRSRRVLRDAASERRKTEKERDAAWGSLKKIASTLVDTLQHFESVIEAFPSAETSTAMSAMAKQAWEQLELAGVQAFGAVGEPFDPKLHRAIKEVPSEGVSGKRVQRVVSRGIQSMGRLVRRAEVVLSVEVNHGSTNRNRSWNDEFGGGDGL